MLHTENFIAYIAELLEKNIMKTEHLIEFLKNLEEGRIVNPISEDLAIELPAHFHRELFQKHIDTVLLDIAQVKEWTRKKAAERDMIAKEREIIRRKTEDIPHLKWWLKGWWQNATKADLKYIDTTIKYDGHYALAYGMAYAPVETFKIHAQDIDVNRTLILARAKTKGVYRKEVVEFLLERSNLDIEEANVMERNFEGANLQKVNIKGANLKGAKYNKNTKFTNGFSPEAVGMIKID